MGIVMSNIFLRFQRNIFAFSLILVLCAAGWTDTNSSYARGLRTSRNGNKLSTCQVNGVTFPCPKGLVSIPSNLSENTLFLYNKKEKFGVFVVVPNTPFDEQQIISKTVELVASQWSNTGSQPFAWKPIKYFKPVSEFETSGGSLKGFNQKIMIQVDYHRLAIKQKSIFVGYVSETAKGNEARDAFSGDAFALPSSACEDSVKIIYSLTGEKENEVDPPCEFTSFRPAS